MKRKIITREDICAKYLFCLDMLGVTDRYIVEKRRGCGGCMYWVINEHCRDHGSYKNIINARTPSELLIACRNRAIRMGEVWDEYVKQLNEE